MPPRFHPISKEKYTERARNLRKLGFNVSYKGNRKPTAQEKAAVTRLHRRIASYLPEHGFQFHRVKKNLQPKVRGVVHPSTITPKGVLVQRPFGVEKKDFKFSVTKKHGVTYQGRNYKDVYIKLNPRKLAVDPEKTVRDAIGKRRPKWVKMVVNGQEARGTAIDPREKLHSLNTFWQYWDELHEDLRSDDEEDREHGGKALSNREIAKIFYLKLIY